MELTKSQKHINGILKRSPVFLLISFIVLVTSIWFSRFSLTYLSWSAIFGLLFTTLAFICWKAESYPLLYWLMFIVAILLVVQGNISSQEWAFPEIRHPGRWLSVQYMSVVFTLFNLTVFALRAWIRKNISNIGISMENANS